MVDDEERAARLALACVVEPGDPRIQGLLESYTPAEVWRSLLTSQADTAWTRRARALDPRPVQVLARRSGLRFLVPGDEEWPVELADLAATEPVQESRGVPLGLWVRGDRPLGPLVARSVAIVGARASTAYGDRVATELASGLVADGVTVVSGGAYGIDVAAHRGALAEQGPTVSVMAGGLDQLYPRAHTSVLERVAEAGAVVSEVPPGEPPSRRRFLTRNRLIAAMTRGTVVVEAGVRSGARNTVTWANALRRQVMAVPGPVSNATSFTPHRLIRENEAVLVTCVGDVLEQVSPAGESLGRKPSQPKLLDWLDAAEKAVYEALPARGSRDAGDLALRAGLTMPAALAALDSLAGGGLASPTADGGWRMGAVQDQPVAPASRRRGGSAGPGAGGSAGQQQRGESAGEQRGESADEQRGESADEQRGESADEQRGGRGG